MSTSQAPSQSSADSPKVVKPPDWAVYMVAASLRVTVDQCMPLNFTSPDAGKLALLESLNRSEASYDYKWPDFAALGNDFAQSMRLRRALVHDTFHALEKTGTIHVGVATAGIGTPKSAGKVPLVKDVKRSKADDSQHASKRHCPQSLSTGKDKSMGKTKEDVTNAFLIDAMNDILDQCGLNVQTYIREGQSPNDLGYDVYQEIMGGDDYDCDCGCCC